jgi:ribosome-binding protein aMBF1 (putative translation factor)
LGHYLCSMETIRKILPYKRNDIGSFDEILDAKYGAEGTPEREAFRKEAYAYCVGQIILDARRQERMTQSDLAKKVGTDKAYISRIERGLIEPGVGMFFRIIDALGLRVDIVRPIM